MDTGVSDEDSSDLFLSPLSPSPPPPIKHSLARKESYTRPQSLFTADPPSPTRSSSLTKVRQPLDFAVSKLNDVHTSHNVESLQASADVDRSKFDDIQDSEEFNMETSGSLKKIPESQFSVSGGGCAMEKSDLERPSLQRDAAQVSSKTKKHGHSDDDPAVELTGSSLPSPLKRNKLCHSDDDPSTESSGSSLPSPLKVASQSLDAEGDKDTVNNEVSDDETDDINVPRWRRHRLGFISSGLDSEKSVCS